MIACKGQLYRKDHKRKDKVISFHPRTSEISLIKVNVIDAYWGKKKLSPRSYNLMGEKILVHSCLKIGKHF